MLTFRTFLPLVVPANAGIYQTDFALLYPRNTIHRNNRLPFRLVLLFHYSYLNFVWYLEFGYWNLLGYWIFVFEFTWYLEFAVEPFSVLDAVNVYSAQRADVVFGIFLI